MSLKGYQVGLSAEELVLEHLRSNGYECLARRWRGRQGEIDLIVRKGCVLAFVEVKARSNLKYKERLVSRKQQMRSSRTALDFLGQHDFAANIDVRFDYALVEDGKISEYVENAWFIEEQASEESFF